MFSAITTAVQEVINKQYAVKKADVEWKRPQKSDFGDIATAVALKMAKELKQKPRDIADTIAKSLANNKAIEKVEVIDPGYINVWLTPEALIEALNGTREACTAKVKRKEPPIIVDFCGPNIAKPLGVHHLGSHTIGQAIINLYKHTGYPVIGWSYPGDWGTQFGKLAVAYEKWGSGKPTAEYTLEELLELYVKFHEEAEKEPTLEEEARAAFKKIEDGDKELRTFWQDTVEVSKAALTELYERMHITVDKETGESFYEDKMEPIIQEGLKKGVITKGEGGALIVEFPEDSGLPPYMLKKSDGTTLYATRDLAMVRYRLDDCHPSAIYYVVDTAQTLHFKQLEATCRLLGWELPEFEHTVFGRMRFTDASMSTRKGTVLRMEEMLQEAIERAAALIKEHGDEVKTDDPEGLAEMMGIGAVAYGMLSQNRKQDIIFDWDKMLSFEGNSAPYIQYTHARARSVIRKSDGGGILKAPDSLKEVEQKDRVLINTLLQFPKSIEEARQNRMPHTLANFLYQLCQDFNSFYNDLPILKAAEDLRCLRLALTDLTAAALKAGAEILTIRVPERM